MSYGHTSTLGRERHHSYAVACAICEMQPARLHAAVLRGGDGEQELRVDIQSVAVHIVAGTRLAFSLRAFRLGL